VSELREELKKLKNEALKTDESSIKEESSEVLSTFGKINRELSLSFLMIGFDRVQSIVHDKGNNQCHESRGVWPESVLSVAMTQVP